MKINPDKILKIYLSIIGGSTVTHSIYLKIYLSIICGSTVTHSIYNMCNAPFKYKQDCIDTYHYKNYKYDSNVEKPKLNRFIDKPNNFDISIYVIEAFGIGLLKGIWMGALFPITIPSSIYCWKVKTDMAELEKIKPS